MSGLHTAAHADEGNTYTVTIPAALSVKNTGWNELPGGITAAGNLEEGAKLVITASSDNGFKLVNESDYTQTVSYDFCASSSDMTPVTSWEFNSLTDEGTAQSAGINVGDCSSKTAGIYTDVVTFRAGVEYSTVAVTSITITNAPAEALFVNSTGTLTASIAPDNATDKNVTWSSSDPDYVSINETTGEYEVKGTKGYGSAEITAAAGGKKDTCTITGKVTYTSLKAGDVIRAGDTFYAGSVSFSTKPAMSFNDTNGVITLVENNGYYKFKRGSNGTMPNVTSFKVTAQTDGVYIVSGAGTTNDRFVLAVHTK